MIQQDALVKVTVSGHEKGHIDSVLRKSKGRWGEDEAGPWVTQGGPQKT